MSEGRVDPGPPELVPAEQAAGDVGEPLVTELRDWSLRALAAEVEACFGVSPYRLRREGAWEALGPAQVGRLAVLPPCCAAALEPCPEGRAAGRVITCRAGHRHTLFGLPATGECLDLFEAVPTLDSGEVLRLGRLLLANGARLQRLSRLAQAADLDERKASFAGVVSHELRTPLTAIQGLTELLLEGVYGAVEEAQAEALERIHQHTASLRDLVEQVLEAAHLDRGSTVSRAEPVCLEDVVRHELALTRTRQPAQLVHFEAEPACPWLAGEPSQLRRIVRALLDNAFKFGRADDQVQVELRSADDPRGRPGLRLVIRHHCEPGVPLSEQRLHDWFEQGDGSRTRRHGGLGLGLFLVTSFVAAHEGHFELRQEVSLVEAVVWLPLTSSRAEWRSSFRPG